MKFRAKTLTWIGLIGVAGLIAQLAFTWALWDRLSFEEIAESIRNPYWVSQGEIYDGISSNVVYYKALDIYYKFSGFHLFAAKEFRFLLSFLSLTAIGISLYASRRFGMSMGVAFLAWVISPTLLFFGTFQASFGIDLQVFPIIGAIWFFSLRSRGTLSLILLFMAVFGTVLLGGAFPPGLFYLPALILVDLFIRQQATEKLGKLLKGLLTRVTVITSAIVSGLIVPFLLIDNPLLLLHDPHTGAGLFRGGGKLSLNPFAFFSSVWRSILDLFEKGDSYQFYLPNPEFGTILGVAVVLVMLILLIVAGNSFRRLGREKIHEILREANFKIALFSAILLVTFLLMSHISPNLPGLRRSAGMLAAFYLFYYLALEYCLHESHFKNVYLKRVLLIILCALPVNHIIQGINNFWILPQNSTEAYPKWLQSHYSAEESLSVLYSEVKTGRPLNCAEVPAGCRYSAPFAALKLLHRSESPDTDDLQVYAEDPNTGTYIFVERSLWRDYYWIH